MLKREVTWWGMFTWVVNERHLGHGVSHVAKIPVDSGLVSWEYSLLPRHGRGVVFHLRHIVAEGSHCFWAPFLHPNPGLLTLRLLCVLLRTGQHVAGGILGMEVGGDAPFWEPSPAVLFFSFFFLIFILTLFYFTILYRFAIHWHESTTGVHVIPNVNPPQSFLWFDSLLPSLPLFRTVKYPWFMVLS